MGFLKRLFGFREDVSPTTHDTICIAAGRGFTFDIVGESQFQQTLSVLCGGKKYGGHKQETTAHLSFGSNLHDPNAIEVAINGKRVGWVPSSLASDLRREVAALNLNGTVACKAKIVGGWVDKDGEGHFGVKLSLSRPLKRSANL